MLLSDKFQEEYGVDVLSKDGMSIGMEILKVKYLEKTGKSWNDIKDLRSPCDIIDLNKVIFPVINFNTPVLQQLLQEMKSLQVSPGRKGYEKHFLLQDVEVVVGVEQWFATVELCHLLNEASKVFNECLFAHRASVFNVNDGHKVLLVASHH